MKFSCSIFFTFLFSNIFAQGYSGKWVGINKDTSFEIFLRITPTDSSYKASADFLEEKKMDISAKKIIQKNDSLNLYFSQPSGNLRLASNAAPTTLLGYWIQSDERTFMSFVPMRRPQTPMPPYAYISDSLQYDNVDKTVHLAATLTKPIGNKKFPVAILITGSGQQDRDETIFDHKPFAIIADYLTKQGVAVLRVDDRMKGLSKGDLTKATSFSFAEDVLTSLQYLKSRTDIDTNKIGLIGHSEGGFISYLAYSLWPHFKFIATLAGQGIQGNEISLKQNLDAINSSIKNKKTTEIFLNLLKPTFKTLGKNYANDSLLSKAIIANFKNWKKALKPSDSTALNETGLNRISPEQYANQYTNALKNNWVKYFWTTNPAPFIEKIKCPFLILNGSNDTQVYSNINVPAIQAALQKGGNKNVTTKIFPGLNHLFQHSKTGKLEEYGLIEETIATEELLQTMGNWIKAMVK